MSGPLRTKQGCWTCRLRRKKCDEGRPHCSICESLSITCYGYGPKPDWMKDEEKKKIVANGIKEIVKQTWRSKATAQSSKRRGPIINIASKSSNNSAENSSSGLGSIHQHDITPPFDMGSSQEDGVTKPQDGSPGLPTPEHSDLSITSMSAVESALLMHFLDGIFPLEYPMYKPGIHKGGRGWLLTLLLRTQPLYHAALALSAYHRTTTFGNIQHLCKAVALVEQEKRIEICIKMIHEFTQQSCPRSGMGILAAVVQLIFLELFTGRCDTWKAHLLAAVNMYRQGCKERLAPFGLAEKSRTILCEDLPLAEYDPLIAEEILTFRFMGATIIWFDITSSITAGTAPHLQSLHSSTIAPNGQTKLEDIIGCKNWAILQISRISALHEHLTQDLLQGHIDYAPFGQTIDDISREIQSGLAQTALEGIKLNEHDSATMFNTTSDPTVLVTQIFAHMASIYLHLVTRGFRTLEVLGVTISEVMRILQTQIPIHLLPALVSPLYVVGSVARQEDQQFFRSAFSSAPLLDPLLKHRKKILPILEEIWSRRQMTSGFSWKDSLELTSDIMLL